MAKTSKFDMLARVFDLRARYDACGKIEYAEGSKFEAIFEYRRDIHDEFLHLASTISGSEIVFVSDDRKWRNLHDGAFKA